MTCEWDVFRIYVVWGNVIVSCRWINCWVGMWRWSVGIELAQDKPGRLMHTQWPGLSVTPRRNFLLLSVEPRYSEDVPLSGKQTVARPLQGLLAAQGALITTVSEDPPAVSRWVEKYLSSAAALTPPHQWCLLAALCDWGIDCYPLCFTGWQGGGIHSWWIGLSEYRVVSSGLVKVQYYSTSGNNKDVPPQSPSGGPPSAEQVLSAAPKGAASPAVNTHGRSCF